MNVHELRKLARKQGLSIAYDPFFRLVTATDKVTGKTVFDGPFYEIAERLEAGEWIADHEP